MTTARPVALVDPAPPTTTVKTRVIDGPIANALFCLDTNANGAGSLFADYSTASDPAANAAGLVARLIVLTTQRQSTDLATVVGQPDGNGATDPAVTAATDRDAALRLTATDIATNQSPLAASTAASAIGLDRRLAAAASTTPPAPQAGLSVRAFRWSDTANWSFRANAATDVDVVPDADGRTRYYDYRCANMAGTVQTWSFSTGLDRRGDLHWSGTAWVNCSLGTRSITGPSGTAGHSAFNYCDGFSTGTGRAAWTDISGRTMASVHAEIRTYPGSDSGVAFADWGPVTAAPFGDAAFPAGSMLGYVRTVSDGIAIAYGPRAGNKWAQLQAGGHRHVRDRDPGRWAGDALHRPDGFGGPAHLRAGLRRTPLQRVRRVPEPGDRCHPGPPEPGR
jgi:hypothetical protein